MQHFSDHSAALRSILPEQLAQSSPDVKPLEHQQPPTWLNSAILRPESQYTAAGAGENLLNLQSNSESSAAASQASNQWLSRSILQRNLSDVQASNDSVIASSNLKNDEGGNNGGSQLVARIDAQLAQSQQVVAKYSGLGHGNLSDDKELDQFLTHYVLLLFSFKEQLQQHVRVHAMEAVMACWEIEQSLQSLTGVSPGEGTGATMSDDEDAQVDSDVNLFDGSLDGHDSMGFGLPTESERSLMERVRQELKHELKQGYKEKLVDIREEILQKRRAGKLPGDTSYTTLLIQRIELVYSTRSLTLRATPLFRNLRLESWVAITFKVAIPTEEDKAKLVQETGLQLK
ncbi:hypothetical protein K7X08_006833 [Anisodus acutangulus]|uniref:ELK domain-containing protein n=1 Tax=Anisodus acutangulus TaxID=402998 RepID=A0A9Q1R106_9SOLA|nr:hypothetical protein K7X08_006833 [Anisodus acutangulus]